MARLLQSCICSQAQLESVPFQDWAEKLGESRKHMHRKVWEWCFVAQAFYERGLLASGRRGLGFAVGQEPLSSLFASYGCEIVATDAPAEAIQGSSWSRTNQHVDDLDPINRRGLCDPQLFRERVTLQHVDMNHIPRDLRDFDLVWSCCAFEHLGSIDHGIEFLRNMAACLKPGGVAVHTTEFNLSSDVDTFSSGENVLFRKRDILEMIEVLRASGCRMDVDFALGEGEADRFIDEPPYAHGPHLRLRFGDYVTTSIGLIIEKTEPHAVRGWSGGDAGKRH